MARTIPAPSNDDFQIAFNALLLQAESKGLQPATDEPLRLFIQEHAEVVAQLNAEVRWLRNIINDRGGNNETTD